MNIEWTFWNKTNDINWNFYFDGKHFQIWTHPWFLIETINFMKIHGRNNITLCSAYRVPLNLIYQYSKWGKLSRINNRYWEICRKEIKLLGVNSTTNDLLLNKQLSHLFIYKQKVLQKLKLEFTTIIKNNSQSYQSLPNWNPTEP